MMKSSHTGIPSVVQIHYLTCWRQTLLSVFSISKSSSFNQIYSQPHNLPSHCPASFFSVFLWENKSMHPYSAICISLSVDIQATWPKFVSRLIYARSVISLSVSDVFIESTLCLVSCRVTTKILLKTDMSKNFQFHTVHRVSLLTVFCIKQSALNKEKNFFRCWCQLNW